MNSAERSGPPPLGSRTPLLGADQVHVWRAALDVPDACIQAFESTLTPDELARADRFRFKMNRDRFVAGRGLLRAILARYLDAHPGQLRFRYGPYGKPALDGACGKNIRFNLSHANGLALYALARDQEIGVDLEQVRPHSLDETIAERYFSPQENALLRALPLHKRPEAFFRYWTRKEACLKARGEGFSASPAQLDVSQVRGEPITLGSTGETFPLDFQWFLRDLDPGPRSVAAIVVEGRSSRLAFDDWLVRLPQTVHPE